MKCHRSYIKFLVLFCMLSLVKTVNGSTIEEKKIILNAIYERIFQATGVSENRPRLILDSHQKIKIAYIDKDKDGATYIGFEEAAFDICESFGERRDDAIAYILGHEISHHILQHNWGADFGSSFSVKSLVEKIDKLDFQNYIKFETQADERGGVYCYMSGFNEAGISENLLKSLYEGYQIEDSDKYPSLSERVKIAHQQDSIVGTYIRVFETANYAMLISKYDLAIESYKYILNKSFHSREIYNNLALAYYYEAISQNEPKAILFYYPVGIDMENRFSLFGSKNEEIVLGYVKGNPNDTESMPFRELLTAQDLFLKAIDVFDESIRFDPEYATAFLNKGCALTILGDFEQANIAFKSAKLKATQQKDTITLNNLTIAQTICSYVEYGHKKRSEEFAEEMEILKLSHEKNSAKLKILAENGNRIAKMNYSIISDDDDYSFDLNEIINYFDSDSEYNKNNLQQTISTYSTRTSIAISSNTRLIIRENANSILYEINDNSNSVIRFKKIKNDLSVYQNILKKGDSYDKMCENLGPPTTFITSKQGMIYNFISNQVFFLLDNSDKIKFWVIYSISDY